MSLSVTVDTKDGTITWAGTEFLRALDIDQSELIGRSVLDLVDGPSSDLVAGLVSGPAWEDCTLDGAHFDISRPFGVVRFDMHRVRYLHRRGAFVALFLFEHAATGGPTPAIGFGQRHPRTGAVASSGGAGRTESPTVSPTMSHTVSHTVSTAAPPAHDGGARQTVDDLTGLPLRAGMLARLDAASIDRSSSVVVVDIDQFGRLNARLGASAGDEILVEVGARLAASVRGGDFAARLSGDRFGVVATVDSQDEARAFAERVERILSEPFELNGSLISIATSIGAAWGTNARSARTHLDHAEVALVDARLSGGRQLRFYEHCDEQTGWTDVAAFAADLRAALTAGHVSVAYQPIVELSTGRLEKLEALARWNHPERGEVSPAEFIPMAERSGTIGELGEWILDRSCADLTRFAAHGIAVDISVNMSVAQLRDPAITALVATVLARHQTDPGRVWIEVTESVLLDDAALTPLRDLHDLGLHLVIDDFGTGYATFQYLTRLPFDALKIDTTFVSGLGVDASDTAIVRSVVNLAQELGLQVVAEGVETESQRAQLVDLGCRLAQGWLFDRALPFDALVASYGRTSAGVLSPASADAVFQEQQRLGALRACKILDTSAEAAFDSVVQLATQILKTPIGLVSLLDSNRQWFKARIGIDITESSREVSFCNHAIAHPREPFVVNDALLDDRFAENPFVVGVGGIRSYAGVPIRSREGLALGTLCVLDTVPRTYSNEQIAQLTMLADQTAALLDLRRRAAELTDLVYSGRASRSSSVHDRVVVTPSTRDGATAVGRAVVELARVTERRDDAPGQPANVLQFGPLELRLSARAVRLNGVDVEMSAKEFDLLAFLCTHVGQAFTRTELLQEVWHSTPRWQNTATVTEHIYRLRSKIEQDPAHPVVIRTVRNFGYRVEPYVGTTDGATTAATGPRRGEFIHDDSQIVAADAGMLNLLMTDEPADVIGHEMLDFVAPSSQPAAQARLEMRATGHAPGPQVISLQTTVGTEIVTMIRSEDVDFTAQPATHVSVREIVDPAHLTRHLMNGVINEVSDAVIVTDPHLHVLSWNTAAEKLYGWSEHEVLGHSLQSVVRSLRPWDLAQVRAEVARSGRWATDADHVTRNGTVIEVVTTVNVIVDATGEPTAIVTVNRPQRERAFVMPALGHDASNWSDVHRAIDRHEFVVCYEPVVRLPDRAVMAVDLGVRWLRPDGGTWDLDDFIADVENADALGDLARFVFPTAFLQFEQWHRAGHMIGVFIDVSISQIADRRFCDTLASVIVRLRLAGSRLWLKVHEGHIRAATDEFRSALTSLAAKGAGIAVCGLGSGWSTADTLRSIQPDALSFDCALVDGPEAPGRGSIGPASNDAAGIIAVGGSLHIPVWVEGVANLQQHLAASRLGCVWASGRLYGEPTLGGHLDVARP